jgi:acetyltransferase-like isoleucine patch superfamily enzyme
MEELIICGKHTYGYEDSITHTWNENTKVIIGNFCSIGSKVEFFLGGNHRTDWITTYPFGHIHKEIFNSFDGKGHPTTKGNIVIGNDVWIGMGSKIMSGVIIGDGAVIAANSVVTKNIEPYTIVGGNPAKFIKKRFNNETIELLLNIKWWNWDDSKINNNLHILCNNDFEQLKKYEQNNF